MPRQYLTTTEFLEGAYGFMLSDQIGSLSTGVLDKFTFRASQRIDAKCKKRIGTPLSTTLSVLANAGDTLISVTSTLGYDNKSEEAVILDNGNGSQEIVSIQPGGITVTSFVSPYPGTITLATPLQYGHSNGASVTGCYREVTEAGSTSSGDPYTEALESQAAQLALAHLPIKSAGLTRVVFTKQYPLIAVTQIEHSFSFDVNYNTVSTSAIIENPNQGWYRFQVGSVIIPEGFMRTTYTAGYLNIPDDIKEATELLVAEQLSAFINPYGVLSDRLGQRSMTFSNGNTGKTFFSQRVDEICANYVRKT